MCQLGVQGANLNTTSLDLKYYIEYFKDFDGVKTLQPVDSDIGKISNMILKYKLNDWNMMLQQHKVMELK